MANHSVALKRRPRNLADAEAGPLRVSKGDTLERGQQTKKEKTGGRFEDPPTPTLWRAEEPGHKQCCRHFERSATAGRFKGQYLISGWSGSLILIRMRDFGAFRKTAVRYWERRRIIYNAALVLPAFFGFAFIDTMLWVGDPHKIHYACIVPWFAASALGANICYSFAYAVEFLFGSDDPTSGWLRSGRKTLFVTGVLFAMFLALIGGTTSPKFTGTMGSSMATRSERFWEHLFLPRLAKVFLLGVAGLAILGFALWWVARLNSERPRTAWKNAALLRLALSVTNQMIRTEVDVLKVRTNAPYSWIDNHVLLMTNGEFIIYEYRHGRNIYFPPHLFLGHCSDGRWLYSSYHFCNNLAMLGGDDPPGSIAEFEKKYSAREFDGKSDVCLKMTE